MRQTIPILMYHQVSLDPIPAFRKYTVTPQAFAAQMRWLALAGYVPITMDALLENRAGRSSRLPDRPIVITFDDGFQDCVEQAGPILASHGFTAIFYLVAGLLGQTSRWLVAERGLELPLVSWTDARRLVADGFQIGSHTLSHPRLADLPAAACYEELRVSRLCLEDGLGVPVRHLAYPFGSFNSTVRAMAAEAGYHSACSVQEGLARLHDDPLAWQRIPIIGSDTLPDFILRLKTDMTVRQFLRRYIRLDFWRQRDGQLL